MDRYPCKYPTVRHQSSRSEAIFQASSQDSPSFEPGGGGGHFQVKDYWGCAAGWGRIFTTGLTIMGLYF